MKQRDIYTAKEAFTFPLFCLVCLASFIYWGCADGWPVGAIVGTSFYGILTLVFVFKYLRFGRDCLQIDAYGIAYKEWSKITSLKWSEIAKCTVCYRLSYGGVILFYRVLDIILILYEAKCPKSISIRLSGMCCRNINVINAIEQFGGSDIYDSQTMQSNNKYVARIFFAAIICIIIIFVYTILTEE